MDQLLSRILDAHGGMGRWRDYEKVEATIVAGGGFYPLKGMIQDATPRCMRAWLHQERSSVLPFGAPDQRTMFTPERIAIEKLDGTVVAERHSPKDSFAGHQMSTPWDTLHRAYFDGEAHWTYFTTAFLLAMDGVHVEEVEPWREGADDKADETHQATRKDERSGGIGPSGCVVRELHANTVRARYQARP